MLRQKAPNGPFATGTAVPPAPGLSPLAGLAQRNPRRTDSAPPPGSSARAPAAARVGNLAATVAAGRHSEPGDLGVATHLTVGRPRPDLHIARPRQQMCLCRRRDSLETVTARTPNGAGCPGCQPTQRAQLSPEVMGFRNAMNTGRHGRSHGSVVQPDAARWGGHYAAWRVLAAAGNPMWCRTRASGSVPCAPGGGQDKDGEYGPGVPVLAPCSWPRCCPAPSRCLPGNVSSWRCSGCGDDRPGHGRLVCRAGAAGRVARDPCEQGRKQDGREYQWQEHPEPVP